MKEKILMVIAVVSLILSITAVALEVKDNITQIDPSKIKGTAWTSTNDGSESTLDADTLDSLHSNKFLRNDESGTIQGDITISGNLDVVGNISKSLKTKYYSIPPCAFTPSTNDAYYISGQGFYNHNPTLNEERYLAPVYIPDGANIVKIYVYYTAENILSHGEIFFYAITPTTTAYYYNMSLYGIHNTSDDPVTSETINRIVSNKDTSYWFYLTLHPSEVYWKLWLGMITIEYTIAE